MDGVVRDILGRQLEAWLTRVVVRGRPSVVALAFGQGALLAAVDSAEVVLGVLAQHADRLRGRQLTVLVLADGNEELPARLGALEATLPAGVAVHLVPGGPARLPVAVKAAGAAGTPLLSYLDGTGATDPAVLAAGAVGRPGELLLVTDTNLPGVTDTDLPSVTDTDRPGAASAPVVPASTGPVPAPPASAVPASVAPGSAPPVPGPPTSDVPASAAPGSAPPVPGLPRSDVPASTAPGSALPTPGPPARVSGSVQASLVRAGFPLATQVDLVPIDGSSARRLALGAGHDRSLEAFKDILWTVDEDAGIRYRDPADPAQHLLHIAADPEPGPLCRELLAELARTGPRTVTELRRHALTATPYRSIDVRRALTEMLTSGAATRDPEHGRLGGNVVITVARRP